MPNSCVAGSRLLLIIIYFKKLIVKITNFKKLIIKIIASKAIVRHFDYPIIIVLQCIFFKPSNNQNV